MDPEPTIPILSRTCLFPQLTSSTGNLRNSFRLTRRESTTHRTSTSLFSRRETTRKTLSKHWRQAQTTTSLSPSTLKH
jgi:hypothetical protein